MGEPTDLERWLAGIGLAEHAEGFRRERVTLDLLPRLQDEDLRALGLPLGDRVRVREALVAMGGAEAATSAASMVPPGSATEPRTSVTAERRQLTVLFCDLVGSTELSQRLDPEELRSSIRRYQDACVGAITRYGGHVAQYLGDGVLAYFGYPVALESGAERAIRAGLSVHDRLAALGGGSDALRARIGIDTGLVVIGQDQSGSEQDRTAVGDAPNIAARLQSLAEPGAVVVSERARSLAAGAFDFRDLGTHSLKGIAEPLRVFAVASDRVAETRFDAATGGAMEAMVGRDVEFSLAMAVWEQVRQGRAQSLLLCGEPGIGKSRIVRALKERLVADGAVPWQYQCSPYYTNSAFYPIVAHFERALRFERDEPPGARLEKVHTMVCGQFGRPERDANLLGRLFGLPAEERYGALAMSPQKQKEETIRALVDLIEVAGGRAPVLFLIEDLHWADPTTLEALDAVVRRLERMRVLVVMTYRPEFKPTWIGQPNVTSLTLGRLDPQQTAAVAASVAGAKPLPAEIVQQIVQKTDGIPLFVEELTKAILESDLLKEEAGRYVLTRPIQALAIPSTLKDSLMARLDRLSPTKELAQIGACIGREFSDELIALVSRLTRSELDFALKQLTDSELVFKRGGGAQTQYVFKHALVQDAAHESLLRSRRAEIHARIARALEKHFPEAVQAEPELVAHHYALAQMTYEAVPYWLKAGKLALESMALNEAVAHLERALALVSELPTSRSQNELELEARTVLGAAWMALGGWFHPRIEETLRPALGLAQALERPDASMLILWGLGIHALTTGRVADSLRWSDTLLETAKSSCDETVTLIAHALASIGCFWSGDLVRARFHVEQTVERYDRERHGHLALLTNHDPRVAAELYRTHYLWMLGYPDQAVASCEELERLAMERGHAFDMGFALTLGQWAYIYRREPDRLSERLDRCIRMASEQGIPFFSVVEPTYIGGFPLLHFGRVQEAVAKFEEGLEIRRSLGGFIARPWILAGYAEALAAGGDFTEAMSSIDLALEQANRPGWLERSHYAELLRLKGWWAFQTGDCETAETCYANSLDWARKHEAKSWELRTATSYARMMQSRGRDKEALKLLRPIYDWFTEGFDTYDLKEAKALLDSLE